MSDDIEVTAADIRRAAAVIVHNGHRDDTGTATILTEAVQLGRVTELFLAVLNVYDTLVPLLHTEAGVGVLRQTIAAMAAREEGERQ